MKYPLAPAGYSFNAAAKTITFTGTVPAAISNIMHVANISRGVIYFQPQAGPLFSGTYASGVLTLACSTTGHANGDQLLVMYDDGATVLPVSGPLTDAQLRAASVPVSGPLTQAQLIAQALQITGTASAVGFQVTSTAQFTRPSDTTAYAAQDVVSDSTTAPTVLTFANVARANGGSGLILSARHIKSSTTTSGASYRLHLYKAAPTAINDNAQFSMLYANRLTRIGFIDFIHQGGGTGSDASHALAPNINLPYLCDASLASLRGILVVTSAYTPVSGEQHMIELSVLQN